MNCPKCHVPLTRFEVDRVALRKCDRCGGELVGKAALDRIEVQPGPVPTALQQDTVFAVAERSDTRARVRCPRCLTMMAKERFRDYQDLTLDFCSACGVYWLDAGEMEKVRIRVADKYAGLSPEQRRRYEKLRQVYQALDLRETRYNVLRDEPVAGPAGPGLGPPGSAVGLLFGLDLVRRTFADEQERHDEIDRETENVLKGHEPPDTTYVPWRRFRKPILVAVIILDLLAMAWMVFHGLAD